MILNTSAILSSRSFSCNAPYYQTSSCCYGWMKAALWTSEVLQILFTSSPIVSFISFSPLFFSVVSVGGISFGKAENTCWVELLWQLHGEKENNTNGKSRIKRKCNVSVFGIRVSQLAFNSIRFTCRAIQSILSMILIDAERASWIYKINYFWSRYQRTCYKVQQ